MRNDAEFTIVSCFPLLLICSTHFTHSCKILLALPTNSSFVGFVPVYGSLLVASLANAVHLHWTHLDSEILIFGTSQPCALSFYTLFFANV
jgi:hypothetical protein